MTRWPFDCGLDVNGAGITTTSDMMSFMTLWQQGAPQADYHGDGAVNAQDLLAFQIDLYGG